MTNQTLTEPEAKSLLEEAGIPVPRFETVETVEEAVSAADEVGYPVVVKVVSPSIQHKSEWAGGTGVHVNCQDAAAVREAAKAIREAATAREEAVDMLVEHNHDTDVGIETLVGGIRDPTFGPVMLFGLGGTTVELLEDVSYRLAPVSSSAAREMTTELATSPVFDGYRGGPSVDREAIAEAIVTLSELLAERADIAEIEINPLLATADTTVALDALVVREGGTDTPP